MKLKLNKKALTRPEYFCLINLATWLDNNFDRNSKKSSVFLSFEAFDRFDMKKFEVTQTFFLICLKQRWCLFKLIFAYVHLIGLLVCRNKHKTRVFFFS